MDAYMRIANCRMLTKMTEDPEYSKRLGLAIESHFLENILVNKENKEKGEKHYGKQKHS